MNPLGNPWSSKRKDPEPTARTGSFTGLHNEKARDVTGKSTLSIEVRGVSAVPSGTYKVEFSEGAPLKHYLRELRILHAATYAAIHDYTYLDRGKCRSTYIPTKDSRIVVSPPSVSPALHTQRGRHDVERIAANMGKPGVGPPPHVVTRKMR